MARRYETDRTSGDAPPQPRLPTVVAIPGTLCSPCVFRRLGACLDGRARFETVSWMTEPGPWDLPSIADRIADRLAREGAGPVLALGHSTGGAIAMRLAIAHPDAVSALVLVNTGAHMRGHGDVDRFLARLSGDSDAHVFEALLARLFATPAEPADVAELRAYAAAVRPEVALEALRSQRELDLTPELAALRCPTTVIHGHLDPVRSADQAKELAASIPGASLRLLEAGHTPVYEAPQAVAAEVLAVLERVLRDEASS
jgi:pimeloyl-ACP methyl ester carboxylesterase